MSSNSKRILILTQYFVPDITAAAYRMRDLFDAMQRSGHKVDLVTTYPHKVEVDTGAPDPAIHRLRVGKVRRRGVLAYLSQYLGFMLSSAVYCIFRLAPKYDYVVVSSPPLFLALTGIVVSRLKRAKLILDVRDIWPDSAVAGNMVSNRGLLYKTAKRIEWLAYSTADEVLCVSQPMKHYISSQNAKVDVRVFYNGVGEDDIRIAEIKDTIGRSSAAHETFTIAYAGNVGIMQDIATVLSAASMLREINLGTRIQFVVIGDGVEGERLKNEAREKGLSNVTFLGAMPKTEVIQWLRKADALLLTLRAHPALEMTIPSKLFDYLLNNKPIISNIQGEGQDILRCLGCSVRFSASDPASLVDAVAKLVLDNGALRKAALSNFEYVRKNFNRTLVFERLANELGGR